MKRKTKWVVLVLVLAALGSTGAWVVVDASARQVAHDVYHDAMALLGLGSGATGDTIFWCPMHPDIRKEVPGTCPI
jgi:Heavy metal binding domain